MSIENGFVCIRRGVAAQDETMRGVLVWRTRDAAQRWCDEHGRAARGWYVEPLVLAAEDRSDG